MWCFQPLDVRSTWCLCWTLVCTAAKKGHRSGLLLMNIRLQQALESSLIQVPPFFFPSRETGAIMGRRGRESMVLAHSVSGAWHSGSVIWKEHMFLIERCQRDPWCLILIAYDSPLQPPPQRGWLAPPTLGRKLLPSACGASLGTALPILSLHYGRDF